VIKWDGFRWVLSYIGEEEPAYASYENTPLPPKTGWRNEREGGKPPKLHYEGGYDDIEETHSVVYKVDCSKRNYKDSAKYCSSKGASIASIHN
jgi:hypothetical protein